MTTKMQLHQYAEILRIRQRARRRDAVITGAVFLGSVLATLALGLLSRLEGREIYLILINLLAFGAGFLVSWVRLEIINNSLALIAVLGDSPTALLRREPATSK